MQAYRSVPPAGSHRGGKRLLHSVVITIAPRVIRASSRMGRLRDCRSGMSSMASQDGWHRNHDRRLKPSGPDCCRRYNRRNEQWTRPSRMVLFRAQAALSSASWFTPNELVYSGSDRAEAPLSKWIWLCVSRMSRDHNFCARPSSAICVIIKESNAPSSHAFMRRA